MLEPELIRDIFTVNIVRPRNPKKILTLILTPAKSWELVVIIVLAEEATGLSGNKHNGLDNGVNWRMIWTSPGNLKCNAQGQIKTGEEYSNTGRPRNVTST